MPFLDRTSSIVEVANFLPDFDESTFPIIDLGASDNNEFPGNNIDDPIDISGNAKITYSGEGAFFLRLQPNKQYNIKGLETINYIIPVRLNDMPVDPSDGSSNFDINMIGEGDGYYGYLNESGGIFYPTGTMIISCNVDTNTTGENYEGLDDDDGEFYIEVLDYSTEDFKIKYGGEYVGIIEPPLPYSIPTTVEQSFLGSTRNSNFDFIVNLPALPENNSYPSLNVTSQTGYMYIRLSSDVDVTCGIGINGTNRDDIETFVTNIIGTSSIEFVVQASNIDLGYSISDTCQLGIKIMDIDVGQYAGALEVNIETPPPPPPPPPISNPDALIVGLDIPRNPLDTDDSYTHKVLTSIPVTSEAYVYKMRCVDGIIGEMAKTLHYNKGNVYEDDRIYQGDYVAKGYFDYLESNEILFKRIMFGFKTLTSKHEALAFLTVLVQGFRLSKILSNNANNRSNSLDTPAYSADYMNRPEFKISSRMTIEDKHKFQYLCHILDTLSSDNGDEEPNLDKKYFMESFNIDEICYTLELNDAFRSALPEVHDIAKGFISLSDDELIELPVELELWVTESCGNDGYQKYT